MELQAVTACNGELGLAASAMLELLRVCVLCLSWFYQDTLGCMRYQVAMPTTIYNIFLLFLVE